MSAVRERQLKINPVRMGDTRCVTDNKRNKKANRIRSCLVRGLLETPRRLPFLLMLQNHGHLADSGSPQAHTPASWCPHRGEIQMQDPNQDLLQETRNLLDCIRTSPCMPHPQPPCTVPAAQKSHSHHYLSILLVH